MSQHDEQDERRRPGMVRLPVETRRRVDAFAAAHGGLSYNAAINALVLTALQVWERAEAGEHGPATVTLDVSASTAMELHALVQLRQEVDRQRQDLDELRAMIDPEHRP